MAPPAPPLRPLRAMGWMRALSPALSVFKLSATEFFLKCPLLRHPRPEQCTQGRMWALGWAPAGKPPTALATLELTLCYPTLRQGMSEGIGVGMAGATLFRMRFAFGGGSTGTTGNVASFWSALPMSPPPLRWLCRCLRGRAHQSLPQPFENVR